MPTLGVTLHSLYFFMCSNPVFMFLLRLAGSDWPHDFLFLFLLFLNNAVFLISICSCEQPGSLRLKQLLVDLAVHRLKSLKSSQCMQWTLRRRLSTLQSSPQGFGFSAESFGFFRSQDCSRVEHETFCLCLKDFEGTYHDLNALFHLVKLVAVLNIVPFACLPAPCRQILQCTTLIRLESWTVKGFAIVTQYIDIDV